jgi:hypothetical protein
MIPISLLPFQFQHLIVRSSDAYVAPSPGGRRVQLPLYTIAVALHIHRHPQR